MVGNISLLYAAKTLANEEPRLDVFLAEEDDKEENKKKINTEPWRQKTRIEIWDVERLGLLFEKDDEFMFSFKIALVSIGIAFVRGASLVFAPEFVYNPLDNGGGNHRRVERVRASVLCLFLF